MLVTLTSQATAWPPALSVPLHWFTAGAVAAALVTSCMDLTGFVTVGTALAAGATTGVGALLPAGVLTAGVIGPGVAGATPGLDVSAVAGVLTAGVLLTGVGVAVDPAATPVLEVLAAAGLLVAAVMVTGASVGVVGFGAAACGSSPSSMPLPDAGTCRRCG